jgi:tetratricopeptide (TPR) repeat protein
MISKLAFLATILFSINSFGQDDSDRGYVFIEKSQKYLNVGKLEKAKKLIDKAKEIDFHGGNPEATAKSRINLIEAQILIRQKMYAEALTILDTTHGASFGVNCAERDSLKIITLFLKYGKQKVKDSFRNLRIESSTNDNQFDASNCAFISELNYNFCFFSDFVVLEDEKTKISFEELAKNMAFYKLLQ